MDPENEDENGNGVPDCFEDFDGDGLSNEGEAAFGLNPYSTDTDGDTMPDDWELAHDFDPTDPSDASQDLDADGYSNAAEYAMSSDPSEGVEADPLRIVKIWTQQSAQKWDLVTQTWENETTADWEWAQIIGPGWGRANSYFLSRHVPGAGKSRYMVKFENTGPNPAHVRWVDAICEKGTSSLKVKTLSPGSLSAPLAGGATSAPIAFPYSAPNIWRTIFTYSTWARDDLETGFDNYERYSEEGQPPNEVVPPWLMLPAEANAHNFFKIYIPNVGGALKFGTTSSAITATPDTTPDATYGPSEIYVIDVKNTAASSVATTDSYVVLTGENQPENDPAVKIVRIARLPKIEYTVQPYKVNCIYTFDSTKVFKPDSDPAGFPSRKELEDRLNLTFAQMNIVFTVKEFKTIDVAYDIGPPSPAGFWEPFAANMRGPGDYPTPYNNVLDIGDPQNNLTPEENAIYNKENHPSDDASVYFVGTEISYHYRNANNFPAKYPVLGYTRHANRQCVIAKSINKEILLHTVDHEIGHMDLDKLDSGLLHPRDPSNDKNPISGGFPLRRLSEDRQRLMYPHPVPLQSEKTRSPELLIYEEWKRYRGGL